MVSTHHYLKNYFESVVFKLLVDESNKTQDAVGYSVFYNT